MARQRKHIMLPTLLLEIRLKDFLRRFPCLYTELKTKVENSVVIIIACAVLHNIAINMGDLPPNDDQPAPEADIDLEMGDRQRLRQQYQNENATVRAVLVQTRFRV
ncbi:hypothetical protein BDFB_014719 [Asbolus verrucosus]|uniref:Uncharacterized protein n=1 Tax=Asbolus verrucosus TaxID=1661398 RepID=A0A482WCZ9_ASBVE|nr:hypothetical protein BDFB_014719 [Asbolus verrucosus]